MAEMLISIQQSGGFFSCYRVFRINHFFKATND